jgi:hypothetical protein
MLGGTSQPGGASGADWAETPDEQEQRRAAIGEYNDRSQGGALIEMILVFTQADRAEVGKLCDAARRLSGDADARGAELVLRALRVYHRVLSDPELAGVAGQAAEPVTDAS